MRLVAAVVMAVLASGCAYKVTPMSARAVNIYSSHDDKVPGRYGLVIDPSVQQVHRVVTPMSHVCAAHSYPVHMDDALAQSVRHTMEMVFEEVTDLQVAPLSANYGETGMAGYAVVKLDEFRPRVTCSPGFWSVTCSATTEVIFAVSVRGPGGLLLSTSAGGSKTVDGSGGQYCDGAAVVLSESIERATRDALERLAERVSSSNKLRPPRAAAH